ncbi:non-homologous end joining protein Ku [Actinacidiphila guanduensis]|uniref:Non-homologous end joining protein Ku n=1 Tax=Actinacidiphila guanduensis TaxID=310781 RepID=A0A1H0HIK9_9ACTN|nr:Ku protein [Actinacidiphila guanduensis]SDO19036.1 DNA end-binding protein Ku [Actinacidiphila guanduensis]
MPRVWSGSLTFSLVTIPVTVEAATSSHKVAFRQIHTEDGGRVRYRKTCELDQQVLQPDDIGRAFEAPDGTLVEITDEELDGMPLPTVKTIEVSGFVGLADVPPEQFDTPYFLAPSSPAANKPYVLMRDALAQSGKAAVGKLALRGSEKLALVRARGDVLVLQMLHWNDELRAPDDAAPRSDVEVGDDELEGALALIDSMSGVSVEDYRDEYGEAVEALLTARMEGTEPAGTAEPRRKEGGETVDLMAALEASVDEARTSRAKGGGRRGGAEVTHLHEHRSRKAAAKKSAAKPSSDAAAEGEDAEGGAPARRTAAKRSGPKAAPKKAAAKKAAAKKQPGKKAAAKSATSATSGKKTAGKKTAAKKTAAKSTKKATPKKAAGKRSGESGRRRTG